MKKIWNVISTTVVVVVVFCAIFLMGSRLMGFRVFNVISGSMEPTYSVGDLIYVQKVNIEEIKVGDPITFVMNEDLVVATHRVIEIDSENQHFYTKGDANDIEDAAPVHFNNVIGVPKFAIPKLGYVSDFIQNPPGMYITVAVGALLIIAVFVPDLISKGKKKEENVCTQTVETDRCVLCMSDTGIAKSRLANARKYYIDGVGQLCEDCYVKLQSQVQKDKQ